MAETLEVRTGIDEAKVEEFLERVVGDLAGTMSTVFCALGDRLGLFRALAEGAGTSEELAARAGVQERYVREWANGLVTAGYLVHDPRSGRFSLPAEHIPVLADEGGLAFLGGAHQFVRELVGDIDTIERAFRDGGGVSLAAYGEGFWTGLARLTGPSFEHQLVQEWIPAVPGLQERLQAGVAVADVGCGAGAAAIKLAQAFPRSTIHGFDIYEPNIVAARDAARAAGVADRVTFIQADAVNAIPGTYDIITYFNVVHDTRDPLALLRATHGALREDGICVIQDANCHEDVEDDRGPIGTVLYGISLLHCMPQSIAEDGAALGTCGLPEATLRALCLEAGFGSVARVAEGPLDLVYDVRP